jgi:hypothetical protein
MGISFHWQPGSTSKIFSRSHALPASGAPGCSHMRLSQLPHEAMIIECNTGKH